MSLDYTFEVEGDLLIVRTSGYDDDINEAVAYGEAIIKNCVEKQCSRLLVDESGVTDVLDIVSQYQMVQRLRPLIPYQLSVAIVANPEHYQDTSFGSMVAENRGINVRVFTAIEDAMEWLK